MRDEQKSLYVSLACVDDRLRDRVLAEIGAEIAVRLRARAQSADLDVQAVKDADAQPLGSASALVLFGAVACLQLGRAVAESVAQRYGVAIEIKDQCL